MKVIFFGTSEFAIPSLEALIEANSGLIAVITAPDRLAGRGKKQILSPVKTWLKESAPKIKILEPEKINDDFISEISKLAPDLGIVASYGKILPQKLIDMFPKGILNVHPSLLSKYRGASPIQTTILNGDTKTGVSIMLVDSKMDHGPILARKELDIASPPEVEWDYEFLHDTLAKFGAKLLIETLPKWINGEITPEVQNESMATYTKMLKKEDGLIDWSKPAEYIERMIRAYNPWPGTFTKMKNGKILKIKKAEISNGKLKILIVQPEGKKEMPYEAFLRGNPDFKAF